MIRFTVTMPLGGGRFTEDVKLANDPTVPIFVMHGREILGHATVRQDGQFMVIKTELLRDQPPGTELTFSGDTVEWLYTEKSGALISIFRVVGLQFEKRGN